MRGAAGRSPAAGLFGCLERIRPGGDGRSALLALQRALHSLCNGLFNGADRGTSPGDDARLDPAISILR
jgi:hypothetical protein